MFLRNSVRITCIPFSNACDIFLDRNLVNEVKCATAYWYKIKIKWIQNYINETSEHLIKFIKKLNLGV